jgi:hypothetical protein
MNVVNNILRRKYPYAHMGEKYPRKKYPRVLEAIPYITYGENVSRKKYPKAYRRNYHQYVLPSSTTRDI